MTDTRNKQNSSFYFLGGFYTKEIVNRNLGFIRMEADIVKYAHLLQGILEDNPPPGLADIQEQHPS